MTQKKEDKHNPKLQSESTAEKNPHPLEMSRITASVGRYQLKKNDRLIVKRKEIYEHITQSAHCYYINTENENIKSVYTYIVFNITNSNIKRIVFQCKQKGLLLRETWPTHQVLFDEQQTETVEKLKTEILTYNVNPMLKPGEIRRFIDIVNFFYEN